MARPVTSPPPPASTLHALAKVPLPEGNQPSHPSGNAHLPDILVLEDPIIGNDGSVEDPATIADPFVDQMEVRKLDELGQSFIESKDVGDEQGSSTVLSMEVDRQLSSSSSSVLAPDVPTTNQQAPSPDSTPTEATSIP